MRKSPIRPRAWHALLAATWLALAPATALASAGGGSGGFGGGGGGGGGGHGGGGIFILYFLFTHPILLAIVVIAIAGLSFVAWVQSVRYRHRRRERERRVELAAAEASEDDEAFAVEKVKAAAATLFTDIQAAWDARDREKLADLVGADLMREWTRRLDDFERKGWHNRVKVLSGPQVEYVGLVNRAEDRDDRAVVRLEATLADFVQDRAGRHIKRSDSATENRYLREYWTLCKRERDGQWMLLSIEQRAEGDHQLAEDLVATPWADTTRLRDEALVEGAAADKLPEGVAVAEVASVGYADDARAAALDLSLADGRFAPDVIDVAVRRAVAAWAEAVDGSDRELSAVASPDALRELLHPGDPSERTRLVVRGPHVRSVRVVELDANAAPPRMTVAVEAEGRRYIEDRDTADVVSGTQSRSTQFTERWTFALDGPDKNPWRIVDAAAAAGGVPARRG
jgi:predicted lipid-binding transport protein (Tim44 family)